MFVLSFCVAFRVSCIDLQFSVLGSICLLSDKYFSIVELASLSSQIFLSVSWLVYLYCGLARESPFRYMFMIVRGKQTFILTTPFGYISSVLSNK